MRSTSWFTLILFMVIASSGCGRKARTDPTSQTGQQPNSQQGVGNQNGASLLPPDLPSPSPPKGSKAPNHPETQELRQRLIGKWEPVPRLKGKEDEYKLNVEYKDSGDFIYSQEDKAKKFVATLKGKWKIHHSWTLSQMPGAKPDTLFLALRIEGQTMPHDTNIEFLDTDLIQHPLLGPRAEWKVGGPRPKWDFDLVKVK